jgi:cytochrome c oxidase cbb3-type subunit III
MFIKQTFSMMGAALLAGGLLIAQGPPQAAQGKAKAAVKGAVPDPTQSPAARPRPKTITPQTYTAAELQVGEVRFGAQCGFCHGRDAAGGEQGPDLTRSEIVALDVRGDRLGPVVRGGRVETGMPSFPMDEAELTAITAFLHKQMDEAATLGGGRRSVEPEDLRTGNAADGRAYFSGAGGCSGCHSAAGDLAGIANRYQGLALLQRMLYPSGRPAPALPKATFTLASGQVVIAPLTGEDEFSVTVMDPLGAPQTYQKSAVKVTIDNPISAHFDQLGKYTDATMHNVYAYLETLK